MRVLVVFFIILLIPPSYARAKSIAEFEASGEGIYNYCPAAFEEDGVRHIYYCTNTKARDVTDSIGYRRAELIDGQWAYSEEKIVLEHTKYWFGWDTVHVCDPDVIKGKFKYMDEQYEYLMAYLGCTTTNNQNNEIGLAVSKDPGGPFIKIDGINPIVSFTRDTSSDERNKAFQWGVGQAALISIDKAGQVLMFYTAGRIDGTYLMCERWDFSIMDNPRPLGESYQMQITNRGSIGRDLKSASINNADAVYDAETGRIYLIADGWPCYIEGTDQPGSPDFISSSIRLMLFSHRFAPNELHGVTFDTGEWKQLAQITHDDSGYPRNHNSGLVHDPYGWALSPDRIDVLYSVSLVNMPSNSLWTYRIHMMTMKLDGDVTK